MVAASLALSGCVPATKYEQATSAAEVEREGHRRAVEKLHAKEEELLRVKAENESLVATKADLTQRLSAEESVAAQTSLNMEGVQKEKELQTELVTQLRGELARVGDHLKVYEGDKEALSEKLAAAETQVSLLEGQIVFLKSKQETSEEAQEKLRGALAELESMQTPKDAAEAPQPEAAPEEVSPEEAAAE